jgi:hypothetical protein
MSVGTCVSVFIWQPGGRGGPCVDLNFVVLDLEQRDDALQGWRV